MFEQQKSNNYFRQKKSSVKLAFAGTLELSLTNSSSAILSAYFFI
ncbi:hypothetical protein PM8797T_06667 [Gimesia maris DSM 8797]|nr:hypothetical protein PM8797T_06667 [Gimesia maris DSM 8797]